MASRSERRARRQGLQGGAAAAAAPPMGPQPPRPVAHGGEEPRRNPFRFIRESWAELRKVEWPSQKQVIQGTAVVLILCIVVGIFLWLSDLAFKHLVQDLFLK